MVKNLKTVQNVDFDSSKEASWGTELNAKKPQVFAKYRYGENQEKTTKCPKNVHFWGIFAFFEVFLDFLSSNTWQRHVLNCILVNCRNKHYKSSLQF